MAAELVRIRLESGAEITHTAEWAAAKRLTILDKPALDKARRSLPAKYPIDLRGQELDAALTEAGLSKSGTAAEKRQRLADHQDPGVPVVGSTTSGGEPATTAPEGASK